MLSGKMVRSKRPKRAVTARQRLLSVLSLGLLLAACSSPTAPQAPPRAPLSTVVASVQPAAAASAGPAAATAQPPAGAAAAATTAPAKPLTGANTAALKLLKTAPEKGPVGTPFTVSGEGLPAGKQVDFLWSTWDGSYALNAGPENVTFQERKFVEKRVPLGRAAVDASGRLSASFTAPDDYGEIHDVFAVADGEDWGKAGFRILRTASIAPTSGRVGDDIVVTVKGVSWKPYENTMTIRYDNKYAGFVSAVTTRGTAIFKLRAAGPVGPHIIQLTGGSAATPYLNMGQSPVANVPLDFRWTFNVTGDGGAPSARADFPEASRVAPLGSGASRTTLSQIPPTSGVAAALEPSSGPILTPASFRASGLKPGAPAELLWVTARGNRIAASGWSLQESSLARATVGQDGALNVKIQIPDDLGGWHAVKLVQAGTAVAEVPYMVERSLVDISPLRVKAGESFTVHLKGVGWTELDNGTAVTYDNAYVGFVCGFNSNGDITMPLIATGGPGTHLIDLYPMLYRQGGTHASEYWNFEIPDLTSLSDHPGLALGYRLPIIRLAIEVVE